MTKSKSYDRVRFKPAVIEEAKRLFEGLCDEKQRKELSFAQEVSTENENWHFDNFEEFLAEYAKDPRRATFTVYPSGAVYTLRLDVYVWADSTTVAVTAPKREEIERIFNHFERFAPECLLPQEPAPAPPDVRVFIGHGRNQLWRDLKDHLHDKHGIEVEAYEIGARAGHTIRDILEEMLDVSSFALLVLTGEDQTGDGKLRARQNVIHETGLFQGRLGFSRAIVMLEEGTEEFTNIDGIQQIRFSKGNIKETFGEVLATLRREFPEK